MATTGLARSLDQVRVLIVDEDMRSSASLRSMLLGLGYESTRVAYSGKRALVLASEFSPTVVLLDLELPDMSGYHLAHMMRSHADAHVRRLRLIALAGSGAYASGELAQAAGFHGCLTKPVRRFALNGLLRALRH